MTRSSLPKKRPYPKVEKEVRLAREYERNLPSIVRSLYSLMGIFGYTEEERGDVCKKIENMFGSQTTNNLDQRTQAAVRFLISSDIPEDIFPDPEIFKPGPPNLPTSTPEEILHNMSSDLAPLFPI